MKKKIAAIGLVLCMVFSLCSCGEGPSTGSSTSSSTGPSTGPSTKIDKLTAASLDDKAFYSGTTYDGLKVEVGNTAEYELGDVNVVIADHSVIDITLEKKEVLPSNYISYSIVCKSPGTTSFYFETSDKLVKSEEVEIAVLSNIQSIRFTDASELTFYDWQDTEDRLFEIESNENVSEPQNTLEFISENPDVATIAYDGDAWPDDCCKIKKVGTGETYVYIQTKDGTVQSEKIKVIVAAEAPAEEEEAAADTPVDNSRTVYITPTGKKYHYRKSCAGSNAIETTENTAKSSYDPCKKCAQ